MTARLETQTLPPVQEQFNLEPRQHTAAEIGAALSHAHEFIYKATADPGFQAACIEKKIDPMDGEADPRYWHTLAQYTGRRLSALRKAAADPLKIDALALAVSAPSCLVELLGSDSDHASEQARQNGQKMGGVLGSKIRLFAQKYPATRPSDVITTLNNSANIAIRTASGRQEAAGHIKRRIIGARHEVGNQFIIKNYLGLSCRPGTAKEDRHATDLVVGENDPSNKPPLKVDLKASLKKVGNAPGSDCPYRVIGANHIVMFSLIPPESFGDSFYPSPKAAEELAPVIGSILEQARFDAAHDRIVAVAR